ncbi:MAG: type II toxin-antitoxin system VapC family toxin [Proteobacteria bacterium]|nr:type II toxin-antitoxin system VapC family toxin [Pseudomonadota bacterium]
MILIDTNVILDVVKPDRWTEWSAQALEAAAATDSLGINPIIYGELSVYYERMEDIDVVLEGLQLDLLPLPKAALFLAGKAFQRYRRAGGTKVNVLPDFFIGAHAAVTDSALLTRDTTRIRSHFPTVRLIAPEKQP